MDADKPTENPNIEIVEIEASGREEAEAIAEKMFPTYKRVEKPDWLPPDFGKAR